MRDTERMRGEYEWMKVRLETMDTSEENRIHDEQILSPHVLSLEQFIVYSSVELMADEAVAQFSKSLSN